MGEEIYLVIGVLGSVVGGALGARLSNATIWKGVATAVLATVVQYAVIMFTDIEQPIVVSLVFLVAAGLIGGRWGLRMTARQLSIVVIGSFLFSLLFGLAYAYTMVSPTGS